MQSNSGGYDTDIRAHLPNPSCGGGGCHTSTNSSNANNTLKIEVFDANNVSVVQYQDNTDYTIKISLAKSNVVSPLTAGFQATFFDATNNAAGTFPGISNNPNVREANVGGVKFVTHRNSNVSTIVVGSTVEWTFQWRTPSLGANNIIISALGNDANASSTSAGDLIYHAFLFLPKQPIGVKDVSKGIDAIYPNPTTDQLTIKLDKEAASNISVYSVTGQLIKQLGATGNKVNLDVSELPNGNYILAIEQNGNFARQQFVKY